MTVSYILKRTDDSGKATMKLHLKRNTYLFLMLLIAGFSIICHLLLSPPAIATSDHANLSLTPFTAREQKDLIKTQEQEESLDVSGPLVQQMTADHAQSRVLNLNRPASQTPSK